MFISSVTLSFQNILYGGVPPDGFTLNVPENPEVSQSISS